MCLLNFNFSDAQGHGEPSEGTDVPHCQAALRQHGNFFLHQQFHDAITY